MKKISSFWHSFFSSGFMIAVTLTPLFLLIAKFGFQFFAEGYVLLSMLVMGYFGVYWMNRASLLRQLYLDNEKITISHHGKKSFFFLNNINKIEEDRFVFPREITITYNGNDAVTFIPKIGIPNPFKTHSIIKKINHKKKELNNIIQKTKDFRKLENTQGTFEITNLAETCFESGMTHTSKQLILEAAKKYSRIQEKNKKSLYYSGIILKYTGYFSSVKLLPTEKAIQYLEASRKTFYTLIENNTGNKEEYYNRYLQSTELLMYELTKGTKTGTFRRFYPVSEELKEKIIALKKEVFTIAKAYHYNEQIFAIGERVFNRFRRKTYRVS